MEKKQKNLFKVLVMTTVLATTIGLVTTISVGENEKTYLCEADRILDGFSAGTAANAYPNGVTIGEVQYPSYSTGLEYSTKKSSGEAGTLGNPYKASVARGTCTDTSVELPEYYYDGQYYYKLIGIDHDGFNAQKPVKNESGTELGCFDLTSITSLKEFTLVGSQAFAYTSLSTIEFSSNLTDLSPSTFFHCKNLETTKFIQLEGEDDSITGTYAAFSTIGDHCFADCIKYTGMTLPRTLTNIGNGAYQNCTSLTSIFLPATDVQSQRLEIGSYAFAGCTKVTIVYISSKVHKIGEYAFEGCINAKGYSALPYDELLTQLQQGGSGQDWNYLFNDDIYDNEGAHNSYLDFTGRENKGDLLYDQPYFYSFNDYGGVTLDLFDGSTSDNPNDKYLYNVKRIIPETRGSAEYPVTAIGQELFKNDTTMTELVIPSSVKIIDRAAFAGCTNLSKIGLTAGLKRINEYAFAPWNNVGSETQSNELTELLIPKTVEYIADYAFPYMFKMKNIVFDGSENDTSQLKHIGKYAFYKAGNYYKDRALTDNNFQEVRNPLILNMHPEGGEEYQLATQDNHGRPNCTHKAYTEIDDFAFFGNQWIGSIRIASDYLVIDAYVFANCYWIVEADLGEGVVIMGNGKEVANDTNGRGRTFSMCVNENSINSNTSTNDLGGPLEDNSDAHSKPYVPMSSLYLPLLKGAQYVGQSTLEGRYQTMVYTSGAYDENSKYYFQWTNYNTNADLMPTYLDRATPSTGAGSTLSAGSGFSNDASKKSGYTNYYGVDLAYGSTYQEATFSETTYYYQLKQGGYHSIFFAHANVNKHIGENNQITYTTTYKDGSGNVISSIDTTKRYAFTVYDASTGRAKFDFVQTGVNSDYLIMTKFHYNPYWEQSKNVVVPQNITFAGRTFTVSEIGNCAFFRNICPQTHAWVKGTNNGYHYVSPQSDTTEANKPNTNRNKDSAGVYYADENDQFFNLESVELPNTITRIGGNAFYMCAGLQSVKTTGKAEGTLPDTLTKIQQYAFSYTGITTISLPNTITQLGNPSNLCNPFFGCLALTSISVASGNANATFKTVNNYLMNNAGNTIVLSPLGTTNTQIEINASVTTIGSLSFRGANNIKDVIIPANLTTIGDGAFDQIEHGEIRKDNKDRPEKTHKGVFDREKSALETVTVKNGADSKLSSIGSFAFYYCTQFQGIQFPNKLTRIGARAFYRCESANEYYLPNSLQKIGKKAFYANTSFNKIRTTAKPNGEDEGYLNLAATSIDELGESAFSIKWDGFDTLSLPSQLTDLNAHRLFIEDDNGSYPYLETVYINNATTSMNAAVFRNCTGLSEFKTWTGSLNNGQIPSGTDQNSNALPSGLTTIGNNCFYGCSDFPGFASFPASLTTIGNSAFSGCNHSGFTTANFSASTGDLVINDSAFSGCTSLTTVSFLSASGSRDKAGGSLDIKTNAFYGCTSLTSAIYIPRGSKASAGAFKNSKISAVYICDKYDDAKGQIADSIASNTPGENSVYYYAEDANDKGSAPGNAKFWKYDNNGNAYIWPSL